MDNNLEESFTNLRKNKDNYTNSIISYLQKDQANAVLNAFDFLLHVELLENIDNNSFKIMNDFFRSLNAFLSNKNTNTQNFIYESAKKVNDLQSKESENSPFHELIESILIEQNIMMNSDEIANEILVRYPNKFQTLKETPQKIIRNELEKKSINSKWKDKSNERKFFKDFNSNKFGLLEWLSSEEKNYIMEHNAIPDHIVDQYNFSDNVNLKTNTILEKLTSLGDIQKIVSDAKKNEGVFEDKLQSFEHKSVELTNLLNEKLNKYEEEAQKKHKDLDLIIQSVGANDAFELYGLEVKRLVKANGWFIFGFLIAIIAIFGVGYDGYIFIPDDIQKLINEHTWMIIGYRIVLMIPLITLASFFWSNYNQNKKLLEDYNHKKIVARTLMSNFNTIRTQTTLNDEKSFEVLFASVENMLENPVKNAFKSNQSNSNISADEIMRIIKLSK